MTAENAPIKKILTLWRQTNFINSLTSDVLVLRGFNFIFLLIFRMRRRHSYVITAYFFKLYLNILKGISYLNKSSKELRYKICSGQYGLV